MQGEQGGEIKEIAGRTTSRDVDRILTVVWPILLWLVAGWMLRDIDSPYFEGMSDGVFALLTVHAGVMLARHYTARGGDEAVQMRKGVMIGVCVVVATLAASAVALTLYWR
jgi:hypothetical protein